MKKTIYVVGVGGRTGVMFGRELQEACDIVGVGMDREIKALSGGKINVRRTGHLPEKFCVKAILPEDFRAQAEKKYPDFIWMAIRNPVAEAVEFYYRNFRDNENIPALVLSQNGLSAINDARAGLVRALGPAAAKVQIVRVSLINGVDMKIEDGVAFDPAGAAASRSGTVEISYKIPIKLGFGAMFGRGDDFKKIMQDSRMKFQEFKGVDISRMENSKLFTNLIGMAAAIRGLSVSAGLLDKNVFKEEAAMLREYVLAVKKSGSGFVDDFCGYPIKFLAGIMLLPPALLVPSRAIFERVVAKGRNRPKDLSEIDYYNGEAVKLGKQAGVATPANERIVAAAKEILKNRKP